MTAEARTRKKPRFTVISFAVALLSACAFTSSAVTPWTILINTNFVVNITNYNANVTNTNNAAAIQNAINAAAAGGTTNGLSGGTVEIPSGVFLSGPFTLKSAVNLQLDSGAILRMLDFTNYPKTFFTNLAATYVTNGSTITTNQTTNVTWTATDFITASSLHDIEISGQGLIDGQGLVWWPYANTNGDTRPVMIRLSSCNRSLIQDVILSNSPMFHIAVGGGSAANTTVQRVTIRAPSSGANPPSHNTDADDMSGSNILVQNNNISVGDDNFTCGGGTSEIMISNNVYGYGHGVSIGSYTSPSVSNMTVVNCSFTNTDCGLRIKSDRDRGGFVHNIAYYNLSMTNVMKAILIYTEYTNAVSMYRAVDNISPAVAASYPGAPVVLGKTPMYRDITISNLFATVQSTRAGGLIWGLPEMCISNVTIIKINISSSKTFGIYHAKNVKIIDSSHAVPAGVSQFSFYDADVTFSNSMPSSTVVTLDGVATNGIGNNFAFYNSQMTLKNTNAMALNSSVTLASSTFTISNNLTLFPGNNLNFMVGTNAATLVVKGNLALGGTNNIIAGPGFANGTYILMTYTGTLSGNLPAIGSKPAGYTCTLDTSTAGQVKLIVGASVPPPPAPANLLASATNSLVTLTWSPVPAATSYNVKRSIVSGTAYATIASGITATNYLDAQVTNGVTYYYVVSGINAGGEGTNSIEISATPPAPEFFSDFFAGSTLNVSTSSPPVPNGTGYQVLSSKSWNPQPAMGMGHLTFGINPTTSGCIEAQALFSAAPAVLTAAGDSISLIITFTNLSGLLNQSCLMGFGLYNSGGNYPVSGGLNGTATTGFTTAVLGNAQAWAGYVAQLSFTNGASQILTRPVQGGPANNNQDVVTSGSGSSSYNSPAGITLGIPSSSASVVLASGNPYTDVLNITVVTPGTLAITNFLYAGNGTNGLLLSQFGAQVSGTNTLASSFDALAIGWRATTNSYATTIDINKIAVETSLMPPPLLTPTNIVAQMTGNRLQLSWPGDHIGWRLQIQTNNTGLGLGTNWFDVPNSTGTNQVSVPVDPANDNVFLRMVYP